MISCISFALLGAGISIACAACVIAAVGILVAGEIGTEGAITVILAGFAAVIAGCSACAGYGASTFLSAVDPCCWTYCYQVGVPVDSVVTSVCS